MKLIKFKSRYRNNPFDLETMKQVCEYCKKHFILYTRYRAGEKYITFDNKKNCEMMGLLLAYHNILFLNWDVTMEEKLKRLEHYIKENSSIS